MQFFDSFSKWNYYILLTWYALSWSLAGLQQRNNYSSAAKSFIPSIKTVYLPKKLHIRSKSDTTMTLKHNHNSNSHRGWRHTISAAVEFLELRCSWFVQFYLLFYTIVQPLSPPSEEEDEDEWWCSPSCGAVVIVAVVVTCQWKLSTTISGFTHNRGSHVSHSFVKRWQSEAGF